MFLTVIRVIVGLMVYLNFGYLMGHLVHTHYYLWGVKEKERKEVGKRKIPWSFYFLWPFFIFDEWHCPNVPDCHKDCVDAENYKLNIMIFWPLKLILGFVIFICFLSCVLSLVIFEYAVDNAGKIKKLILWPVRKAFRLTS